MLLYLRPNEVEQIALLETLILFGDCSELAAILGIEEMDKAESGFAETPAIFVLDSNCVAFWKV